MLSRKLVLCMLLLGVSLSTVAGIASDLVLPAGIKDFMATRQMRYHHYLWHNVRNNWSRLSNETQQTLTDLGWGCPRPARSYNAEGVATQILDNGAGEDFFFMHRYMIALFNKASVLYNTSFGDVVGWTTVPAPGDEDYPTPANYTITGSSVSYNYTKTESFYENDIVYYEDLYTDPDFLRNVTLGELGARVEITIHNYMHLRFSANSSYGFRPAVSSIIPNISTTWDNPEYDWMGDFYGSHVNGYFWKLHGWVDNRIEDWRKANNLTSIVFNGTWIGGPMSAFSVVTDGETEEDMEMEEQMDNTMPTVADLLRQEANETTPGDFVQINPPNYKNGTNLASP